MEKNYFDCVAEARDFLARKVKIRPQIMMTLTGGVTDLIKKIEEPVTISSSDVPLFPKARAEGHAGKMIFGKIGDVPLVVLQGRFHYYEGLCLRDVVFPIFVMNALGAKTLIVTNAVGGINKDFNVGDVMLITDHINFMGDNPLRGISIETPGNQFSDMTNAYSATLQKLAREAADEIGMPLKEGVFIGVTGPSYETRQEIRAFRALGADAVGMSVVPEIIVANYLKMDTLGLSCVANPGADIHEGCMNHNEVLAAMKKSEVEISKLLLTILSKLRAMA